MFNELKEQLFNTVAVGADNGYDSSKTTVLYQGKIHRFRRPSFVAPGEPSRVSMQGEEVDLFGYKTKGQDGTDQLFTVGDEQDNILRTDNSNFGNSPAARVLLYHCIREALASVGYDGKAPVYCYTGLPVDQYYIGSQRHTRNIDAKLDNLNPAKFDSYPVLPLGQSLGPMPNFSFIGCAAQAVSAWYSYAMEMDWTNYRPTRVQGVGEKKTVVIDFGGRTIDIIPMHKGAPSFSDKQSIHDRGTIYLAELLKEEIALHCDHIDYQERLQFRDFRQAVIDGTLTVFGHTYDVSRQRDSAIERYRNELAPMLFSKLEAMTAYNEVLFCGGPAELLVGNDYQRWVPRLLKTADIRTLQPSHMNSDGMAFFALNAALSTISSRLAQQA